jgi:tight adherence protein C
VNATLAGAALGGLAGTGLWLIASQAPALRRPRLDDRLAPYLRDAPRPSRLLATSTTLTPFPTLERLLGPVLGDAIRLLNRWLGGVGTLRRRLVQAGRGMTVEEFRAEQVVWGTSGLLIGVVLLVLSLASGRSDSPLALLVLTVLGAVIGVLARDRWLTREVAQREQRMLMEFPTIAELERVCRVSTGELTRELRTALGDARAGATLVQALEGIAARTSLAPLARFVDGIAIAVERGTPLADVLRAQAVDVREAGKRDLLESAGRREIGMLVPVVFLILPVTIVFAFYPGLYGLTLTS